ncbi:MAG: hypothetical protein GF311_17115 [Candidatus Lokiarchaeota archaeon]|nr:hypothetical protein [Candidatus Lokiarchaeota archaeon]MBD3340788.1 hypothetical protein [Candidatus Lokiarchaeota archaeon]
MDYYSFESFNITQYIEPCQGKRLDDLFRNQTIIQNDMGEFLELIWTEDQFPQEFSFQRTKVGLYRNLKTVYNIGKHTEKKMRKRGVRSLYELRTNLRFRNAASEIIEQIQSKDFKALCKNRYIYDLDVSFCFNLEDFLFLDVETLGIYDSPIIILGIGYFRNKKFIIRIFFAREIEEEIAICEHFKNFILPRFKCFVTYNGKSFDIPYIANRMMYYFDKNPMISDDDAPYRKSNTLFHHIDLYHNCRRRYKGLLSNYTLTTIEKYLLNMERENDLPGNLVSFFYQKYLEKPQKYVGLIKECIEHNYWDIYSMPLLYQKLLM